MLVDANIVLRLSDNGSPLHAQARQALEAAHSSGRILHWCAQVMIEYWAVATRPREANGLGLTPDVANANLTDFQDLMGWLPKPPDIGERWRALVVQHQVRGRQVHDARLVALMLAHGVTEILTFNTADFARYGVVTCVSPADL